MTHAESSIRPEQDGKHRQIPEHFVKKCGVKGLELLVSRWAVRKIDFQTPRQVRRSSEQLLIEVVTQPTDCLS